MELTTLQNGIFGSNTYIFSNRNECAIIDCGVNPEQVLKILQENGLKARYIILTHGHVDHIYHADSQVQSTGALLCLHEEELSLYYDNDKNGYSLFSFSRALNTPTPDCLLKHGDKLPLGDAYLEIIHTPGHSPGSISILSDNKLITGDTLFEAGVGRTDLYGGSSRKLADSIRNRLYTLDGGTEVFPGHGQPTSIGYERENNPYV
jgi:glyoxylase-like metal-dependent hydrolase (beta-lactamase superfamily II)